MYRDFFGFSEKPFNLTPDPDFLYLSQSHKEALAHLTYGVESKSGFVLITGDVGAGKTTLLRTLIRNLGGSVLLSQVSNTRVSYKELLEMILRDFGVHPGAMGKTALLSALNDFLIEKYREGRNCVLLIDEAQNLGVPTLEGVRMLSNLETEKAKLLHTILVGQPGLRDLIDSPELEQLRQRISVRYHLGPLTAGEVGEYIRHRLGKVEKDPERTPVFSDEVIPKIHAATGGLPRLINVLCDAALLHAYVGDSRTITEAVVSSAAEQVLKDQKGRTPENSDPPTSGEKKVDARISEIEARLSSMMADAARVSLSGASSHRLSERANHLVAREKVLQEMETALEGRAATVERREQALAERVSKVREEWKRRVERLEQSRRELLERGPTGHFPTVSIQVYDSDPRLQSALKEALESTNAEVEIHGDYDSFVEGARESGLCGQFGIAVLGSVPDDPVNTARVAQLVGEFPQTPIIYLSDLDLSTLRHRILSAGANYFLEKPNTRVGSFAAHLDAIDHFKAELLGTIEGVTRQYRAFFETYVARRAEGRGNE